MTKESVYIVAVSGGVDSVCLLDMLVHGDQRLQAYIHYPAKLVVAHVNHGIRGDEADRDEKFVGDLATRYGLVLESVKLHLGKDASEEVARDARYAELQKLQHKYHALGILLAHHKNDVLETAVINILRGTGRRGVSALKSSSDRIRPLLHMTKAEVLNYASDNNLRWVEDSTNSSSNYLRNRVRLALNNSTEQMRHEALDKIASISTKNELLDKEIATILQYKLKGIAIMSRTWFVKLPHIVACELMHAVLTKLQVQNIDKELVERLVAALKVGRPGKSYDVDKHTSALLTKRSMRIVDRENFKARRL